MKMVLKNIRFATLIVTLIFGVSVAFAQSAADKVYNIGLQLQKTMSVSAQNQAIAKFTSAKKLYDSAAKKAQCDQAITVSRNIISQINSKSSSSSPTKKPNGGVGSSATVQAAKPRLNVNPPAFNVDCTERTLNVNVDTNIDDWQVIPIMNSDGSSFVTAYKTGSKMLEITLPVNNQATDREQTVIVLNDDLSAEINITQKGNPNVVASGGASSVSGNVSAGDVRLSQDGRNIDITYNGVPFKMIFVESGPFYMGYTDDQKAQFTHGESDEGKKPHRVNITQNFFIGETEVTQQLWNAVMEIRPNENPSVQKGDQYPVSNVSWNDAIRFVNRLNDYFRQHGINYRFNLPTEAQWEYAARGAHKVTPTVFGSNNISEVGWFATNSNGRMKEVKQLKPNELGIYDMTGNVWELCRDWKAPYSEKAVDDPTGPEQGDKNMNKVRRGGSFEEDDVNMFRVSYRRRVPIDSQDYRNGFRLIMTTVD